MNSPCRYCVAPERHPGCHDHCEKRAAYYESDEYKRLCEYKNTYLKCPPESSAKIDKVMRRFKQKGYQLSGFKSVRGA